ncbi:Small heat shock protein C3 [Porphyridium purpureum]|uniref:Small heat shock protein C3 n=1 Tax=Porphyridium purpureum TaxID=35688 RepID=A0A5J4YVJ7_PORPP|nr:Small heat shock protein C3 [Porphyridium purpureum]|eukprot:POR3921..scf209_3
MRVYHIRPSVVKRLATKSTKRNKEKAAKSVAKRASSPMALRTRPAVSSHLAYPTGRANTFELIDRLLGAPFGTTRDDWNSLLEPVRASPPSLLSEFDDKYVMTIEAPGIPKEKIQLEVKDNVLKVSGGMEENVTEDGENGDGKGEKVTHGYVARSFHRSLTLGNDVDIDKISASAKDGIVTIELPKHGREEPATRLIEIK